MPLLRGRGVRRRASMLPVLACGARRGTALPSLQVVERGSRTRQGARPMGRSSTYGLASSDLNVDNPGRRHRWVVWRRGVLPTRSNAKRRHAFLLTTLLPDGQSHP
jgi:hypothetical protein